MLVRPGRLMGRGFGGGFSPLSLSPHLWLDPSDLSTMFQDSSMTTPVTADGDPVGAILDKSGNGHHLTQSTAGSRPLYKTSGGLHWLEFDGVDDALTRVNINAVLPVSLVAGIRQISWTLQGTLFKGGVDECWVLMIGSSPNIRMRVGSDSDSVDSASAAIGADAVLTCLFKAGSSFQIDDGTPGTDGNASANWTHIGVGASHDGINPSNIRFHGGLLFARTVTDPEIALLRTYLAAKQGRVL